jgi:hypothetical protein
MRVIVAGMNTRLSSHFIVEQLHSLLSGTPVRDRRGMRA